MMLKELIIKVDNQEIHLSPKLTVPIEHTNIPIEHCKFRTYKDIFWKVELLEYNSDNKCWKIKVIDYFTNDIQNFDHQKSTKEINRIAFEKFDWPKLEQHLSSYQTIKLLDILDYHDTDRYFREETIPKGVLNFTDTDFPKESMEVSIPQAEDTITSFAPTKREPVIKTYKIEFSVYFSEAYFKLGYVTFSKNIKEIGNKVDFKIENDYILAEFDNIKTWFAKKLKTKKFKVNATINSKDGIITEIIATSPHIAMIDAELIDSIRYHRTFALTKSPKISNTDKSLFTADEIFREMETDDIEGNVFKQNEQDILSLFLYHHKTRNRKQLEYLSGSKHSMNVKLRFTLHPNFGFLFLIEGKENNHFVWELLNSHSTYIWSIDKLEREIEIQYKRIEASINAIRDYGREQYKREFRQNHLDSDLVFSAIEHEDITSNFVDGFVKWKHKLNEKII
jgi:hypothetical protein